MKKALINRFRIFDLDLPFFIKIELFVWSFASPLAKRIGITLPSFRLKFCNSLIHICDGTDLGTFFEVFVDKEYAIKSNITDVKRILDLGANCGYASIYFADIYKDAEIVSVEPDANNIKKIIRNIAPYNGRIIVEVSAVSSKKGKIDFYRNFKTSISGSTVSRDKNAEKISVTSTTLEELEKKYGEFDIIKFDIEGGEWEALRLEALHHQPYVWIGEYHEDITGRPLRDFNSRFGRYSIDMREIGKMRFVLTFTNKTT